MTTSSHSGLPSRLDRAAAAANNACTMVILLDIAGFASTAIDG
jgi:hypothetical protein